MDLDGMRRKEELRVLGVIGEGKTVIRIYSMENIFLIKEKENGLQFCKILSVPGC